MQIMTVSKAIVAEKLQVGDIVELEAMEVEGRVITVDDKYYKIELGSPEQVEAWKKEKADGQPNEG